jgi:signal transduction histidine kinase
VTLYEPDAGILEHAFYLDDDERLSERENIPLPPGQGLEWGVISGRRAILTDDYERECRERGLHPDGKGVYAWLSIPLSAGADVIGVVSVASRDASRLFTEEQATLLQAISDQAAGAIVKARLLQESERRARQLATLNEIGRGLTSTLEPKRLLDQILQSAVEILNCEAGSLFLVDASNGDLVFEVVTGPVAQDLLGKHLPPGTGMVGQAVQAGKPIIANDAKRRKEWSQVTDRQTGFDTQDLLAAPMQYQDRIIGVIEVINKRDGLPFTPADQELLMTFTSQATIAIENARLYTLTDQALAARVEELSIMQRIDRELNASLEAERAMRITLEWALRRSGAEAGLVGMVEGNTLLVMASQGYRDELRQYRSQESGGRPAGETRLPVATLEAVRTGVESGQIRSALIEDAGALLTNGRFQTVAPIRRELQTIGVLMLESVRPESPASDALEFVARLCDHAAAAIANARLYAEVQEANKAKSKFVSFVAHELKNPMTVIKGNTELVARGMAGPVNELQSGFLATVRANVDRMNTIVSDLNDLTKIQVGSLRLDFKSVRVSDVIEDVIRSLSQQIKDKGQDMILKIDPKLPDVWADPGRLNQILTNLVSNAVKYTPEGGKVIVGVQSEPADGGSAKARRLMLVHIRVQDTGIGIKAEDQTKIFQSYFRTENAKDMASGTGLGLNITKSLVEMQGGRIWFESVEGQGSTFHFSIPAVEGG